MTIGLSAVSRSPKASWKIISFMRQEEYNYADNYLALEVISIDGQYNYNKLSKVNIIIIN